MILLKYDLGLLSWWLVAVHWFLSSAYAGFGLWFWEGMLYFSVKSECICVLGLREVLPRKRSEFSCIYSQSWSRAPCVYQSSNRKSLLPSWWIWNKWSIIGWHPACSKPKVSLFGSSLLFMHFFFALLITYMNCFVKYTRLLLVLHPPNICFWCLTRVWCMCMLFLFSST